MWNRLEVCEKPEITGKEYVNIEMLEYRGCIAVSKNTETSEYWDFGLYHSEKEKEIERISSI